MGKKYLETKKGSLESSILGVWEEAAETKEGAMKRLATGGKEALKGYKKKPKKEEVEVDEAKRHPSGLRNISKGTFPTKGVKVHPRPAKGKSKKPVPAGGKSKKEEVKEEIEQEIAEITALVEELDEGILGNIAKAAGKTVAKGAKKVGSAIKDKIKAKAKKSFIGRAVKKVKSGISKVKSVGSKIKKAVKTGQAYGDQYDPMLEKLEVLETRLNQYNSVPLEEWYELAEERGMLNEASGDKEAYQKFFNGALKKFKVGSPAELKGDQKKKFYDYIDANWEGDNEKAEQVKEFKVQSMKDALMKVWDIDEGKLPPALQKAIDEKKKDKGEEEEESVKKKNEKSDTGKPMAKIDMKPKDSKE